MPTVIVTFSDILQIFVKISLIAWEEEGDKIDNLHFFLGNR